MPKFLVALLLFLSVLGPCSGMEYLDDSIYSNSSKEVQKIQQLLKTLFEDPERNCYDRDIMQKNFELFLQDISVLKLDPENDDKACVEISNCKDIEQNIIFLSGLMDLMKSPQGNHSIRWKLHDYNGPWATDYYSIISPRSTLYIDISLAEYDNKDYVTPVAVYKDDIMPYSSYSIISNSIFYMEMEETFLFLDDFVTRHTVTFADIPQNSDEYIKYAKLYATGVIEGYEDHTFRRNQFVSRGEFVAILYRYKYSSGVLQNQEHSFFSDVPADSYYHPYITEAHSKKMDKWL